MTEKEVANAFIRHYGYRELVLRNCHIADWEADLISVSHSYYLSEYEIKVDRQDLRSEFDRDFDKPLRVNGGVAVLTCGRLSA